MQILVHERVIEKRPWLDEYNLINTWNYAWKTGLRETNGSPHHLALGWYIDGRLIEMIAFESATPDTWVIFHAMQATKRFAREIGISRLQMRTLFGRR